VIATLPNSFTHARIGHYPREVEAEIIYWVFQIAGVDLHHALIELLLIVRLMPAIVQRAGQHKFSGRYRVGVFPLPRRGRGQTKWARDTSGSERRDTIADPLWAIEKYIQRISLPSKMPEYSLNSGLDRCNNVMPVLVGTFARNRPGISTSSAIPNASAVMELCSALTIKT